MVCRAANLLFENFGRACLAQRSLLSRQRFKQALETSNATLGGVGAKKSVFFALRCEKKLSGDNTLLIDDFIQEAFLISGHLARSAQSLDQHPERRINPLLR